MARPQTPPSELPLPITIDGRTAWTLHTPILRDAEGAPLVGRTCEITVTTYDGTPIHDTINGYAHAMGDGSYVFTITARALWLRLASYDGALVTLLVQVRGADPVRLRARVVVAPSATPVAP
jgi:hypothetical protein